MYKHMKTLLFCYQLPLPTLSEVTYKRLHGCVQGKEKECERGIGLQELDSCSLLLKHIKGFM